VAELHPIDRALDGAAGGVTHDENEPGTRRGAGEFEAPEQVVIGDVARNARVEGVADPGVEDDLGWRARVDTAQYRGGRELAARRRTLLRQVVVWVHLPAAEALVAALQHR